MRLFKFLLAFVMALTLVNPVVFKEIDAAGTNISNATTISANQTVSEMYNKDFNYYKIVINSSGYATLDIDSQAEQYRVDLYDVNGEQLYNQHYYKNSVTGESSTNITFKLSSGTYYVSIGATYYEGSYSLTYKFESKTETIKESYANNNDVYHL